MTEFDRFDAMLRGAVAPRLRSAGFTGSGRRFVLPDPDVWRIAAIQRNKWNSPSRVEFTVNLSIVDKGEWRRRRTTSTWLPSQPSGGSVEPIGAWVRIGHLLPIGGDHWWELTPAVDPAVVGAAVALAIVQYGVPWLRGEVRSPDERRAPDAR